jgi:hypothetical protein
MFFNKSQIEPSTVRITLAGTPTTIELSGTFLFTTAFAPIITLLPTCILPIILAPAEI